VVIGEGLLGFQTPSFFMIADFFLNSLLKKQAYLMFLSKAIIVGFLGTNHLRN
jgi:hypothetical protein